MRLFNSCKSVDTQLDNENEAMMKDADTDLDAESDNVHELSEPVYHLTDIADKLVKMMNRSPFVAFTGLKFRFDGKKMIGEVALFPQLIGNPNFQILHGGMTATILDTIGGLQAMFEIYQRGQDTFEEQTKKAKRLATVDLRVDYLAPGRGKTFIATAEVIRMGRKGCTTTMLLVNDEGKKIAHGIASYAF